MHANAINMIIQIIKKGSHFNTFQPCVKSTVDRNLKAKAISIKPNTTFILFIQPPDFGNDCSHCGNIANNINGNANASANPNMPIAGAKFPLPAV